MAESILVPLDGSDQAELVLPSVRQLARLTNASITLLQNVDPSLWLTDLIDTVEPTEPGRTVGMAVDAAALHAREYLEMVAQEVSGQGFTVHTRVTRGITAEEIIEAARLHTYVAMTTHGRSGVGRWLLGSVAEKIINSAPVPVLLVRATTARPDERPPIKRVLVPLDGSELAEHALPLATNLARLAGASLILTHSLDWAQEVSLMRFSDTLAARLIEHRVAVAKEYLEQIQQRSFLRDLSVMTDIRQTEAAASILASANEHSADLMVIATHGRSGLQRWLLGSVAQRVVQHATIPVLLVRATVPVRLPVAEQNLPARAEA